MHETEKQNLLKFTDDEFIQCNLPIRVQNSNKGTYGKTLLICGSRKYYGAALLAAEAACRSGVGIVSLASPDAVNMVCASKLPDVVYRSFDWLSDGAEAIISVGAKYDSVLIGCGCGYGEELRRLICEFLDTEGAPLILDADALNSLALNREESLAHLKSSKREVLLTPHPLEFSRISGLDVSYVNDNREMCAKEFAVNNKVNLLLKGHDTVLSDTSGNLFINTSGSSALSKGGSGDVLSGVIASLTAQGANLYNSAVMGAYLCGRAAEHLAKDISEYSVIASDLPMQVGREIKVILSEKHD